MINQPKLNTCICIPWEHMGDAIRDKKEGRQGAIILSSRLWLELKESAPEGVNPMEEFKASN